MDHSVLIAAVATGVAVFAFGANLRRWASLHQRTDIYLVALRTRQGSRSPSPLSLVAPEPSASGILSSVLGPILSSGAQRVARMLGTRSDDEVRRLLDRAGLREVEVRTFTQQQFAYGVGGLVLGIATGGLIGARWAFVLGIAGAMAGAARKRGELNRLTKRRCERIRLELLTVSSILAVRARATPNVQHVVRDLVARGNGEVVGELARVLDAIAAGTPPDAAFASAAATTPEPAAARLYQTLADKVRAGGELAPALRNQASDIREALRDARRRSATRRRMVMVMATVIFVGPTMILFIAAPIPSIVLGH